MERIELERRVSCLLSFFFMLLTASRRVTGLSLTEAGISWNSLFWSDKNLLELCAVSMAEGSTCKRQSVCVCGWIETRFMQTTGAAGRRQKTTVATKESQEKHIKDQETSWNFK